MENLSEGSDSETEKVSNRKQRMLALKAQKQAEKGKGKKENKKDAEVNLEKEKNEDNEDCEDDDQHLFVDQWQHDQMPVMKAPINVIYCQVCGMPPDYCKYGQRMGECRVWIQQNSPQYLPEADVNDVVDQVEKLSLKSENEILKEDPNESKKKANKKKDVANENHKITIQKQMRARKKATTIVTGLDLFGVKPAVATKVFSKHFACGSTLVKGSSGQPSHIEIQGDVEYDLPEVLFANFQITGDVITCLPSKNKISSAS